MHPETKGIAMPQGWVFISSPMSPWWLAGFLISTYHQGEMGRKTLSGQSLCTAWQEVPWMMTVRVKGKHQLLTQQRCPNMSKPQLDHIKCWTFWSKHVEVPALYRSPRLFQAAQSSKRRLHLPPWAWRVASPSAGRAPASGCGLCGSEILHHWSITKTNELRLQEDVYRISLQ